VSDGPLYLRRYTYRGTYRNADEEGLTPDYVVSSPAERARQTVLAVCGELGIEASQVHRAAAAGERTGLLGLERRACRESLAE